jgi:hypothetical protein
MSKLEKKIYSRFIECTYYTNYTSLQILTLKKYSSRKVLFYESSYAEYKIYNIYLKLVSVF